MGTESNIFLITYNDVVGRASLGEGSSSMNLNSSLESQISTVNDNHVNVSNSSAGHIIQGRLTGSNIGVYIYINRLTLDYQTYVSGQQLSVNDYILYF